MSKEQLTSLIISLPFLATAAEPGFRAFSALHYGTVAACFGVMAMGTRAGIYLHRAHGPHVEQRFRRALGCFALAVFVFSSVWYVLPQNFDWPVSLPLEFCDLGMLVAAGAMLLNIRWLRGLLYFWGTVFTIQAFLTPVLQQGPASIEFWLFWISHTCITGAAVYDMVAGKFRPSFRDGVRSYVISIGYAFCLLILDNVTGWNYGYVGPTKPGTPTLLDALGPYPTRAFWMAVVAAIGFLIALLPWAWATCKR
ncbi:MAG TPA: TIGR02206 family membrane protein [Opitutales bacterium]|nr:TIGR02206 family membrane protein [Opitutales bacterium]